MFFQEEREYEAARAAILSDVRTVYCGLQALRKRSISSTAASNTAASYAAAAAAAAPPDQDATTAAAVAMIAELLDDVRHEFTTHDEQHLIAEEMLVLPNPTAAETDGEGISVSAMGRSTELGAGEEQKEPPPPEPRALAANSGLKGIFGACFADVNDVNPDAK